MKVTKIPKIVAKIGPIQIRKGGFFVMPNQLLRGSSACLLDFLSVNTERDFEVDEYCQKNAYIPRDMREDWYTGFRSEHEEVRQVAKRVENNQITKELIEQILKKLEDMPIRYRAVMEKDVANLNTRLYWLDEEKMPVTLEHPDEEKITAYVLKLPEYLRIQHAIWHELLTHILLNRQIRQCKDTKDCRRWFIPNDRRPNQACCSPECDDRVRKRKKNR